MYKEMLNEIKENKFKEVKAKMLEMHVQDIADLLEQIESPRELLKVFKVLPKPDQRHCCRTPRNHLRRQGGRFHQERRLQKHSE